LYVLVYFLFGKKKMTSKNSAFALCVSNWTKLLQQPTTSTTAAYNMLKLNF